MGAAAGDGGALNAADLQGANAAFPGFLGAGELSPDCCTVSICCGYLAGYRCLFTSTRPALRTRRHEWSSEAR